MNERVITDMERNNRTAMYCHLFEALIIVGTYVVEMLRGNRTALYTGVLVLLAAAPVIGELFFWSRDRKSAMIKHLAAQGFAVMYIFILFTTTNNMTFLYAIPMILVISVYSDRAYTAKISIGIILGNLIVVAAGAVTGGFGFRDMESGLLQMMVVVLVGLYSFFTTMTSEENNRQKLKLANDAHDETERILKNVSMTSQVMQVGVDEIHSRVEQLQESSLATKDAMREVTAGATDTAQAAQEQLQQTGMIGQKVEMVGNAAAEITECMQQTLQVLGAGIRDMDALVKEVDGSVKNSVDAAGKLETLDKYITEMNSIVELIGGITAQTSLLALNASIEAARAGEAGRGFAVVATEISALATQTKDATEHITRLIANVSTSIGQVVAVIRNMIQGINEQKESTGNTAVSFRTIEENTYAIRDNVEQLTGSVEELKVANQEIMDSVQMISAVSQEVSAHASETLEAEEDNMRNLKVIAEQSQELIALTRKDAWLHIKR